MVYLQVEVVEVVTCPGGVLAPTCYSLLFHEVVGQRRCDQVVIGASEREVERGLPLDDGAFHVEFRGNQAQAEVAVVFVHVAVFHAHVDHRGEAASETRRKVAFI